MGNHFWVACAIWDGTESLTIVHAVNVNDTEALRKEVCRRDIALLALGLHDPLRPYELGVDHRRYFRGIRAEPSVILFVSLVILKKASYLQVAVDGG